VAKAQPACGRLGRPSRGRVTPLPNAVSADRMRGAWRRRLDPRKPGL